MEEELPEEAVKALLTASATRDGKLVSLNFKVPLHIRRMIKISAAQQNMTMTELLLKLFAQHFSEQASNSVNKEIKK